MAKSKFEESFLKKNRKEPKEPTKLVAIRLPVSIYKKLQALTKETNTSLTETIIEALKFSLKTDQK